MIQLDPRVGSGELLPYFSAYDVEVNAETQLDYGDACWWGNGPDGSCFVGTERKIIHDLVASMRSDRLSGFQLGGLLSLYEYVYLVVEGNWRCGKGGEIEVLVRDGWVPLRVGSRAVLFREVDHYLATLEHVCNVTIVRTSDRAQTVAFLVSRYKWFNDKEWDKHDSWRAIYAPGPPTPTHVRRGLSIPSPTAVQEVAARFPGVRAKAWGFGRVFESVHEMVNADVVELAKVEGIGMPSASKIYRWLRDKKRSSV